MMVEVHLTGPAGCGKSRLAEKIKALLQEELREGDEACCFSYQRLSTDVCEVEFNFDHIHPQIGRPEYR